MKILFFTSPIEDYLSDSILVGLRTLYGKDCIDFPKCEVLYKNCPSEIMQQVRGYGFTLYSGLLEDLIIDRFNIDYKLLNNYYDLIVFGDIQRQFGWFVHFRPWLKRNNTIIIDGLDTTQPYPARGRWWRRSYYWLLPFAHRPFLYFKREWTPDTHFYFWMRAFHPFIRRKFPQPKNLRKISFSIPEEKIINFIPVKKKDFPKHIVDQEIAAKIEGANTSYAFQSEDEYYNDLRESRFGITTKRGGWDCLRHYEIAANGAVICFRDLHKKPSTCAPHGLVDGVNCISYCDFDDLTEKIKALSSMEYTELQSNSIQWAKENSSKKRAQQLLLQISQFSKVAGNDDDNQRDAFFPLNLQVDI